MPLERVYDDIGEVLGMLLTAGQTFTVRCGDRVDPEGHRHGLDLICVLVLGHAHQVFVHVLCCFHVLSHTLFELVKSAPKRDELHEFEDKFVLIFVLLQLIVVLVLLEEKTGLQLVSALDPEDVLVKAPLQVSCVGVHNSKVFEEVEVAHVDHCAVHLTEAHISHFTQ